MKRKRWLLVLLIAFPSIFWLLLETSTINSKRMPFYGPKNVDANGDTAYHSVTDGFFAGDRVHHLDPDQFPLFVAVFASEKYRDENYRLGGLSEYIRFKPDEIAEIPFVFLTQRSHESAVRDMQPATGNIKLSCYSWPDNSYDSLQRSFFRQKPYYIDYSFLVLVDRDRHIRGYYDGRYSAEIKRLEAEYRHLRLKEEKKKLIQENEIQKGN